MLNKPINTGMKIFDLSKFRMYDIWYNLLKPTFVDALSLILMDTDSFVYFIKGINKRTYNKIVLSNPKFKNYLDFSKFSKNYPLYTKSSTDCGKMKSEREGHMIRYAVALRSKMYYLLLFQKRKKSDIEKVKGITNAVKIKLIKGENYVNSILGQTLLVHNQTRIQLKKHHKLYTLQ